MWGWNVLFHPVRFKTEITMTVKSFFKGFWEGFKFLFLTPNWGSKRRREQQAYEARLDEAMRKRER